MPKGSDVSPTLAGNGARNLRWVDAESPGQAALRRESANLRLVEPANPSNCMIRQLRLAGPLSAKVIAWGRLRIPPGPQIRGIILLRAGIEMLRVYAMRGIAGVIQLLAFRDRAHKHLVAHVMCSPNLAVVIDLAVATMAEALQPEPAIAAWSLSWREIDAGKKLAAGGAKVLVTDAPTEALAAQKTVCRFLGFACRHAQAFYHNPWKGRKSCRRKSDTTLQADP